WGGRKPDEIDLWAVHPGGRSVLDAVEGALALPQGALWASRDVLDRFGNMSSATVMFVLKQLMESGRKGLGCAMAFGPGLTAETMLFRTAGAGTDPVSVLDFSRRASTPELMDTEVTGFEEFRACLADLERVN